MKKLMTLLFVFSAFFMTQCSGDASKSSSAEPSMMYSKGATVYACACGASCKCNTISMKPGKCGCGGDLAKATVTSADSNEIVLNVNGTSKTMKASPKYKCGCGPSCSCGYVSDKPGKCACGADLVEK